MNRRPLLLTPGEPAGIGPDLCVSVAQKGLNHRLVAVADPALLQERAQKLQIPLTLTPYDPMSDPEAGPGRLEVVPVELPIPSQCGVLESANAAYVLAALDKAAELCLDGEAAALVTGPVHKGNINDAGIPFTGHTEYLAVRAGGRPVMMLATPGLRVALVTTHLPLSKVSDAITPERLKYVVRTLSDELRRRFAIKNPLILVCGLNPHAGEGGHLGMEEIETITPVLNELRSEGILLEGPFSADTILNPDNLERADAVLAMYHDQGLPVLKYKGFGRAVNVTFGLPIIRTSVDHGTALELAGTGQAATGSLEYAIEVAAQMAGLN